MKQSDGSWVPAENVKGERYAPVTTDGLGSYEFTDLPAGEFKAVFSGGGIFQGKYRATVQKAAGVGASVNSDAEGSYLADGILEKGEITGITMPEAADIRSSMYVIRYQDFGLVPAAAPTQTDDAGKQSGAPVSTYDNDNDNGNMPEAPPETAVRKSSDLPGGSEAGREDAIAYLPEYPAIIINDYLNAETADDPEHRIDKAADPIGAGASGGGITPDNRTGPADVMNQTVPAKQRGTRPLPDHNIREVDPETPLAPLARTGDSPAILWMFFLPAGLSVFGAVFITWKRKKR